VGTVLLLAFQGLTTEVVRLCVCACMCVCVCVCLSGCEHLDFVGPEGLTTETVRLC